MSESKKIVKANMRENLKNKANNKILFRRKRNLLKEADLFREVYLPKREKRITLLLEEPYSDHSKIYLENWIIKP